MTNGLQVSTSGASATSLTYDLNGNMTSDGTNSYAWDAENRMIKITYPGSGNNSQFTYDGYGKNVQIVETSGGSVTSTKQFVWCDNTRCEQRDASSSVTAQFFNRGESIGVNKYVYTRDHLNSVRVMADSLGNVQASYDFDAFGRITRSVESTAADFTYAGYYLHGRSGLSLTLTRAYSSNFGSFLNRDTVDFMDGSNSFAYANGNPISLNDPSGLRGLTPGEKDFINKWFPGCFTAKDLDRKFNIQHTNFRDFSPANGDIWINRPFDSSPSDAGAFGHEVFHVVQANQSGNFLAQAAIQQGMNIASETAYDPYAYDKNQPILPQFQNGNVEAQGQIVQDMITGAIVNGGVIPPNFKPVFDEIKKRCKCKGK